MWVDTKNIRFGDRSEVGRREEEREINRHEQRYGTEI